jgi:hypothetical protein
MVTVFRGAITGRHSRRHAVFSPRKGTGTPISRFFTAEKRKHNHAAR